MKLYGNENNITIMKELGQRIKYVRISMNLTQTDMADKSGVALSTIVRLEQGESVKIDNILNVMRVIGVLPNLDLLIEEQVLKPTEIVDRGKQRKRVSKTRKQERKSDWKWGDEK